MGGIGDFLGGIGRILNKVPIQGRRERWRNEIENLKKEKAILIKGVCDEKKAKRVLDLDNRVSYLEQLCKNAEGE